MRMKGRLIVFEGIDGAGKSTLSLKLADWLQQQGTDVLHLSFPGKQHRSLGKLIYSLHHAPGQFDVDALHPGSRQILHVAAHVEAIEYTILPALTAGKTVVLDRFWWSMIAYGLTTGIDRKVLVLLARIEKRFWGRVKPSVVFLLRRSSAKADYGASVACNYEELVKKESSLYPVSIIENDGSLEEAFDKIVAQVQRPKRFSNQGLKPVIVGPELPLVFSKLSPAKTSVVYDTYWKFAAERQAIFFRRLRGETSPWTEDPILREFKFTNAYRASDRVSQYLIKEVIYKGDQSAAELGFRVLLFKFFNKIETWELLRNRLGDLRAAEFTPSRFGEVLGQASQNGTVLYSGAYIMPSGGKLNPGSKHRMHLALLDSMLRDKLFNRITEAKRMRDAFEMLRRYPTIGDFLAFQYLTDLNYSKLLNFSEMEFILPGPGAKDGIRKCFTDLAGLSEADAIRFVADRQNNEFSRLGINFQSLWGRPLQLIDCQNLFCEVDKYARRKHPEISGHTGRARIKQKFRPTAVAITKYWYPPKWQINEKILQST